MRKGITKLKGKTHQGPYQDDPTKEVSQLFNWLIHHFQSFGLFIYS